MKSTGLLRPTRSSDDARVSTQFLFVDMTACGRAAVSASTCPLDGTTMEPRDDALDLAVRQTLAHGGDVLAVEHRHDLDPVEGIGAILRF